MWASVRSACADPRAPFVQLDANPTAVAEAPLLAALGRLFLQPAPNCINSHPPFFYSNVDPKFTKYSHEDVLDYVHAT